MHRHIPTLTVLIMSAGALTANIMGCELVAAVDRSKIASTGGSSVSNCDWSREAGM